MAAGALSTATTAAENDARGRDDVARIAKLPQPLSMRREDASPWITVQQAADYLGVGKDMIYAACQAGEMAHSKLGHGTIRLKRQWVDAWAESRATGGDRIARQ